MNFYDMIVGIPYIVTKDSDDTSFLAGDQITLLKDGSILDKQAEGWLEPEDVQEAIIGMECEIDINRIQDMIKKKEAALNNLKEMI